jgi:hypothetical protein
MSAETPVQQRVVDALVNRRWTVDANDGETVYLSKRVSRSQTFYAQVDRDGNCDGNEQAVAVAAGVRR